MKGFFLSGATYDAVVFALFLFQMVFMDTTATIPTGAMAERWKFSRFIVYGFFIVDVHLSALRQLGLGRRLALARSARTSASATGTWTSPARRSCTWSAVSRPSLARSCSGPRLGKFTRTASRSRSPATTSRWRSSARSSSPSAGSGSTRARRSPARDLRIGVVATNTMLASAAGAFSAMMLHVDALRQARPQHDVQRHARRPRGDHRALRVRHSARLRS